MIIVKLSGKALHDNNSLMALFDRLQGEQAIIVHGGGVEVDHILNALNFTSTKLKGIRVSPKEQMPYIAGTLAGQCNKLLQGVAIKSHLKAVGMLCTDFDLCALKPYPAEYGQVASCSAKDPTVVKSLLAQGITPVVCSIGLDEQGELYNINADEVASALAICFKAPLVFFSDVKGVLDANKELIPEINGTNMQQLIDDEVIKDGMLVKVQSAYQVAKASQAPVFIASIFDKEALDNLCKLEHIGTAIKAQA